MKAIFALAAALLLTGAATADDKGLADIVSASGFKGYALATRGEQTLIDADVGTPARPDGPAAGERRWPWASVTKQVMAVLAMQEVERGRLALDAPADRYIDTLAKGMAVPTIRQLIQHQSGLRNANDSPQSAESNPTFYGAGFDRLGFCLTERSAPGGNWSYNNCDYFVLEAVLRAVTGKDAVALFAERIAKPLGLTQSYMLPGADPEEAIGSGKASMFAGFGAGGALSGPPRELAKIDRALLNGTLLKPESRAVLWEGNPALGYMALGQWAFTAPLKGCAKPVRIIERRGAIDATQVRNIILPDQDAIVILFTTDGDFDFGEIWQGKGASHDILAAVACT